MLGREQLTWTAFALSFARISNLTFGGGGPTVAAFQRELVAKRHWLSPEQFALAYALSRITPGTNLFAFCTAVGSMLRGTRGAIVALLAASIPCCAIVAILTAGFDRWSANPWVNAAIGGALAASVGILFASFWSIVEPYFTKCAWPRTAVIAVAGFLLSLKLSPVLVLALAGLAGWFWREPD
jgi:chromate transporter